MWHMRWLGSYTNLPSPSDPAMWTGCPLRSPTKVCVFCAGKPPCRPQVFLKTPATVETACGVHLSHQHLLHHIHSLLPYTLYVAHIFCSLTVPPLWELEYIHELPHLSPHIISTATCDGAVGCGNVGYGLLRASTHILSSPIRSLLGCNCCW